MLPKCDEHKEAELKMFCYDHEKVCCSVCVSTKHRSCKKVDNVTKVAKGKDFKIEQYLTSLETFGKVDVSPTTTELALSSDNVPTTPAVTAQQVYSVVHKQKYSVKMKGDKRECDITGCCKLPVGNIVIVDNNNSKAKLLNPQYNAIAHCGTDEYPQDICHVVDSEVAVTICDWSDIHEIQFVNAGKGKLTLTRTVKLNHDCDGIAHYAGQLYVGSINELYIYTIAGQMVKKLYEDTSGGKPLYRFAISNGDNRVYLTNYAAHSLITLDNTGRTLSTFTESDLACPTGVCVSENGSVLVCGHISNTVVQVNSDGKKKIATLATSSDAVNFPQSVYFGRNTSELIVGQDDDNIIVLKIT